MKQKRYDIFSVVYELVFIKIDYIGCSVSILSCIYLSVFIFNLLCDGQYQIKCQYILYLHVRNLK